MPLRVVLIDDHPGFRAQARALLEAEGSHVAGEAGDGIGGLAVVRAARPDLVLLDVMLPGPDGFAVAERIASQPPAPPVILISSRDAADCGAHITDAPVRGFLAKADLSSAAIGALLDE